IRRGGDQWYLFRGITGCDSAQSPSDPRWIADPTEGEVDLRLQHRPNPTTGSMSSDRSYRRLSSQRIIAMLPKTEGRAHSGAYMELLYEEYQRPVLAYLTRLVSDRETAEDLCQETFIKAMRGWEGRDSSASVGAWLYRIATNTAYDYLRRRR